VEERTLFHQRLTTESRLSRLSPHLRGHLFYFDGKPATHCDASTAARLVLVYLILEVLVGPRLSILEWLHLSLPSVWIRVSALIVLALLLVRWLARAKPAQIGLRRWREWSLTERSYFFQTVLLGNLVFGLLFAHALWIVASDSSKWPQAFLVVLTQLGWGIYQELVYRGILQTAIVSRWGPLLGILLANTLFTFGPLHFYHFYDVSPAPMFAGIFAIGLLFSVLFWRSRNLWLVGVLHGIGNAYIEGLPTLLK
jgi:uncharacterized protein